MNNDWPLFSKCTVVHNAASSSAPFTATPSSPVTVATWQRGSYNFEMIHSHWRRKRGKWVFACAPGRGEHAVIKAGVINVTFMEFKRMSHSCRTFGVFHFCSITGCNELWNYKSQIPRGHYAVVFVRWNHANLTVVSQMIVLVYFIGRMYFVFRVFLRFF